MRERLKILDNRNLFNLLTICIVLSCMYMRYKVAYATPDLPYFIYYLFPTHLRFDTLWLGTFIAFHYNYTPSVFKRIFTGKKWFLFGSIAFIIPLIFPIDSPFLAVFGLTLIALSFGITLATFLADDGHEAFLNTILGKKTVYVLAKIGTYSYAIYLFHAMIIIIVQPFVPNVWIRLLKTLLVFFATLIVGVVATELIEKPILKWRNKYVK